MELTKQVPSLELCKKLKELGWDKETLYGWYTDECKFYVEYDAVAESESELAREHGAFYTPIRIEPAPTVAELGEVMPCKVKISGMDMYLETVKHEDYFECYYKFLNVACSVFFQEATEADARAKMWIYLKENKLL